MSVHSLNNSDTGGPAAIILAAGKGTRMNADLPKVLHEVGGRPMVCAVIDACREVGCGRIVVVVGYKHELVCEALADQADVEFALQDPQHGTGHAVRITQDLFDQERSGTGHEVFVLCGDGPLIRAVTLETILARHRELNAAATLATAILDDPTGYGRIIRDATGGFRAIVEQKNCDPQQLAVREVNPSYYCFEARAMFDALEQVKRNELSGEYYVTDVPELLLGQDRVVEVIQAVPEEDVLSINTVEDLELVDNVYRQRVGAVQIDPMSPGATG